MRIASASSVIQYVDTRKDTGATLVGGQSVTIESHGDVGLPGITAYAPDLKREIEAGRAAVTSIQFNQGVHSQLDLQGIAVGGSTGTIAGAGIGLLLEQLRAVSPTSAVVFDAACAAIGCAIGAAVGSGKFKLGWTIDKEGKVGVSIEPVSYEA